MWGVRTYISVLATAFWIWEESSFIYTITHPNNMERQIRRENKTLRFNMSGPPLWRRKKNPIKQINGPSSILTFNKPVSQLGWGTFVKVHEIKLCEDQDNKAALLPCSVFNSPKNDRLKCFGPTIKMDARGLNDSGHIYLTTTSTPPPPSSFPSVSTLPIIIPHDSPHTPQFSGMSWI